MANLIYKASAGSGKTYTLVLQYLLLALKGASDDRFKPNYFSSILAITFTKKATAEMKERIIEQLWENIQHPENGMAVQISKELGLTSEEVVKRSQQTLNALLSEYGKFSVGTIDSFFQQILKSFLQEIGLAANIEVELDTELIKETIATNFLAKLGTEEAASSTKSLMEIYSEGLENGERIYTSSIIKKLVNQILSESFQPFRSAVEVLATNADVVNYYQERLKKIVATWKAEIFETVDEIIAICNNAGLTVDDFPGKSRGYLAAIQKMTVLKRNNPVSIEPGKGFQKTIDGNGYTFKDKTHDAASTVFYKSLAGPNDRMLYLLGEPKRAAISADIMLKNWSNTALMEALSLELKLYRDNEKRVPISDTGNLLSGLMQGNDVPFIYEKIGNRFQHIFIDEFQDTSSQQWQNLLPLLLNNTAVGNENLLVGDLKQSIYRFRGGDVSLLQHRAISELGTHTIEDRSGTMDTNFRSSPEVVNFNNALYIKDGLPALVVNKYLIPEIANEEIEAGNIILDAYSSEPQQCKRINQSGYVEVAIHEFQLPKKADKKVAPIEETDIEEEEENESIGNWVKLQLTQTLEKLAEKDFAPSDICILTNTHSESGKVTKYLNEWRSELLESKQAHLLPFTNLVNESSLKVADAITVKLIIAALSWLAEPKNEVKKLETKWLYSVVKDGADKANFPFERLIEDKFIDQKDAAIEGLLRQIYVRTRNLGFYEVIEMLIRNWDLSQKAVYYLETKHLNAFTDTVIHYANTEGGTLKEFIAWWGIKAEKLSVSASEQQQAIKLMTIHKSKGLQFPVVIMPFANWDLKWKKDQAPSRWHITSSSAPLEPTTDELDLLQGRLPVFLELSKSFTTSNFQDIYCNELELTALDALNKLYVGTTRAEQALFIFAEYKPTKDQKIKTTGHILKARLSAGESHIENFRQVEPNEFTDDYGWHNILTYKVGEWEPFKKLEKTKDSKATNLPFEEAVPSYEWRNRLFIKPQAGNFFESGAYLAMSGKETGLLPIYKNVVGNYLHEALAQVSNTSELLGWIKNAHLEGIINTQVMEQLIARADLIIQDQELNNLLNSGTTVLNERVIITKDTFQQKRPDRVQFTDSEVICIDFKTGEANKKHNAQIATYMELLQEMYPNKQVLGKLVYITESELTIENVVANNKEVV